MAGRDYRHQKIMAIGGGPTSGSLHGSDIYNRVVDASGSSFVVSPVAPNPAHWFWEWFIGGVGASAEVDDYVFPNMGVWPVSAAWGEPIDTALASGEVSLYGGEYGYHNRVDAHYRFHSLCTTPYEKYELHRQNFYTLSYSASVTPPGSASLLLWVRGDYGTGWPDKFFMTTRTYCSTAAHVSLREGIDPVAHNPPGGIDISNHIHNNNRENTTSASGYLYHTEDEPTVLSAYAGTPITSADVFGILEQGLIGANGGYVDFGATNRQNAEWVLSYDWYALTNNNYCMLEALVSAGAAKETVIFTVQWIERRATGSVNPDHGSYHFGEV